MTTSGGGHVRSFTLSSTSRYLVEFTWLAKLFDDMPLRLCTMEGHPVLFVFDAPRPRREIVVCADEAAKLPLLRIESRQIGAVDHDVLDGTSGELLGVLHRRRLPLVPDQLVIIGGTGEEIGAAEKHPARKQKGRFPRLLPAYDVVVEDTRVASVRRRGLGATLELELPPAKLEPRLVLAVVLFFLLAPRPPHLTPA